LAVYDDEAGLRAVHLPQLASQQLQSLADEAAGGLWLGSAAGVARLQDGQAEQWRHADDAELNEVEAILVDRQGRVWFGTNDGLVLLEGDAWRRFRQT